MWLANRSRHRMRGAPWYSWEYTWVHLSLVCIWSSPIPTAMPGATVAGTVLALFAHLWAWWDRATGEGPCPMPVFPEPKHNQGVPTHYMIHHAPAGVYGSQPAVNYQKQTSVGSTTCGSSTPRVRKAGCCGSHLQAEIHTHVKGSGMHMVLKCLATHFNAIEETCIYWQPHKHKQHFYKHPAQSYLGIRTEGLWQTHTQIPGRWPWASDFCSSWSLHQLPLQLLHPDL